MLLLTLRILVTTAIVVLCAHLIPGLVILDMMDAVFFGLVLGIINSVIRPILTLLTLPINILTLGLFSLVINAFTFWLATEISYGVEIKTLWGALVGGGIIWITSWLTNRLLWRQGPYA